MQYLSITVWILTVLPILFKDYVFLNSERQFWLENGFRDCEYIHAKPKTFDTFLLHDFRGIHFRIFYKNENNASFFIKVSHRQKISCDITDLNSIFNHLDTIEIYMIFHLTTAKYIFSSRSHGTFIEIHHIWTIKHVRNLNNKNN